MQRQTKRVVRDGIDQVCVGFEILAVSLQLLLQTGKIIGVIGPEGGALGYFLQDPLLVGLVTVQLKNKRIEASQ